MLGPRTYPYTATRVKVMKSLLLTKGDYTKLRKMGLNEMIRFLEEREYKKEIDSLSAEYRGMELINLALNQNLSNTVNKLIGISTKETYELVRKYTMKWAVGNIKIIIRSRDWNLARKAIIPVSPTTYEYCAALIKKEKGEFVKEARKIIGVSEAFEKFYENGDIISMENELDKSYYNTLVSIYKTLGAGVLKSFYRFLVELNDIKNIMKLKSMGMSKEIIGGLVMTKNRLTSTLIGESMENAVKFLKESRYGSFAEGIETDLSALENNIEKYLLQYSFRLLHLKPLSIAPIFGYLLAKEIEVRNLKLLINSRAVELEEEFVEKNLVVEGMTAS